MKNLVSLCLALFCLIFIALACGGSKSGNTSTTSSTPAPATNTGDTTKPAAPAGPAISTLKWADYDKIYNVKSNSTDMQKEAAWKDFEGKYVAWEGTVVEVSEGTLSGLTVSVKMNPNTITSDIVIIPKDTQKEKMMALTKGKKISFTGRLKTAGGAILPLTIDDGEIK